MDGGREGWMMDGWREGGRDGGDGGDGGGGGGDKLPAT